MNPGTGTSTDAEERRAVVRPFNLSSVGDEFAHGGRHRVEQTARFHPEMGNKFAPATLVTNSRSVGLIHILPVAAE